MKSRPMNPEGGEVDDAQVQYGCLSIFVHIGQTPSFDEWVDIILTEYLPSAKQYHATVTNIFNERDVAFIQKILGEGYTPLLKFEIKLILDDNTEKIVKEYIVNNLIKYFFIPIIAYLSYSSTLNIFLTCLNMVIPLLL